MAYFFSLQDCFVGGESRLRFYQMGYNIRDCPLRTFLMYSWLVIENATEADAELIYSCQASFIASNPFQHYVSKTVNHSLTPSEFFSSRLARSCIPVASLVLHKSYIIMINFAVYPSLEIIRLETPSLQPGVVSPYFLEPHETLQWNCSVQAGEGDRLVWLLNGTVIPSSLVIDTQQVCKIVKKKRSLHIQYLFINMTIQKMELYIAYYKHTVQ